MSKILRITKSSSYAGIIMEKFDDADNDAPELSIDTNMNERGLLQLHALIHHFC